MRKIALFALLCGLSLPAHAAGEVAFAPLTFAKLSGWYNDSHAEALEAFKRSCTKLSPLPEDALVGQGKLAIRAGYWHKPCAEAALVPAGDNVGARAFFEREFAPVRMKVDGSETGKFTGYYEPLIKASREKKPGYEEPIYARPADLANNQAYIYDRKAIDEGALKGKNLELLWAQDAIDAFFLHVQGSGRVLLDTGETVAVRFDGKNNQPYTAIGKVLVERGAFRPDEVTAPKIKDWLRHHPKDMRDIFHRNQSYVFFQLAPDVEEGPAGAQNVPLIPERSMAVDASFIPLGAPVWLETTLPRSAFGRGEAYNHLLVAQDKGSAILGAIRGDVFFGHGERAEDLAGHMNQEGRLAVLVPKAALSVVTGR